MKRIRDDSRVNAVGQEGETLLEKRTSDDDNGGGAVSGSGVLGLGELDKHLGSGLKDLHLVENGGTVVGNDDLAIGGGDHLVHAFGAKAGTDRIGDGACGDDVGLADVLFALVVDVGLGLGGGGSGLGSHCWCRRRHGR